MKSTGVMLLCISAVITLLGVMLISDYYNGAITAEITIDKTYKNNQNIASSYSLQMADAIQIPEIAKNDIVEVIKAAIQGRYGDNGSQAAWQWIKEQNPNVDPALYRDFNVMIQAGRTKFENAQTKLLDVCGNYDIVRNRLLSGAIIRLMGFPKDPDLAKKCTPIRDQHAIDIFETGVDKSLKLGQ